MSEHCKSLEVFSHIFVVLHIVSLVCLSQGEAKEELQKSRSKVEELNNAKNEAEKNNSRLASDLKALREKSEKVRCPLYKWQKKKKCVCANILQNVRYF